MPCIHRMRILSEFFGITSFQKACCTGMANACGMFHTLSAEAFLEMTQAQG